MFYIAKAGSGYFNLLDMEFETYQDARDFIDSKNLNPTYHVIVRK